MTDNDLKTFAITYDFSKAAHTIGYTIKARDEDDARLKAAEAIDEHGCFNMEKFEELGGDISRGSWTTDDGDFAYELSDDIEEIDD